jgi:formyltetrahydrofolate deformylase
MSEEYTEITVVGDDDTGLIARVTSLLFERGINIEDLDQDVRQGVFRMTMHVDTSEMVVTRQTLRSDLADLGADLGLDVQVRFPTDRDARRLGVLVTKESHCLERLLDARADGELGAEIAVVVGNHDDLHPLVDDFEEEIPFYDVGDADGRVDEEWLLEILAEHEVDLVVLARFMRILSPDVVFRYENRIVNVHPSLLPSFPGAAAYRQAVEEGVRIAGVTAHYVTTDLDQGPIIAQRAFTVPEEVYRQGPDQQADPDVAADRLRAVGQPLEAEVLMEAVRMHLGGDTVVRHGRTELREGADDYQLGLPDSLDADLPAEPVDRSPTVREREVGDD